MPTALNNTFIYSELVKPTFNEYGDSVVVGSVSRKSVRGTVQTMTGSELVPYMEGSRGTGVVKVYSSERLSIRSQECDKVGYVLFGGSWYELVDEMQYTVLSPIGHWKYAACKIPVDQVPEELK